MSDTPSPNKQSAECVWCNQRVSRYKAVDPGGETTLWAAADGSAECVRSLSGLHRIGYAL